MRFASVKDVVLGVFNLYSHLTLFVVFVHQCSIALSVYASIKLVESIGTIDVTDQVNANEQSFVFIWLVVYLSSMILPHVLAYFSDIWRERWLCTVLNDFWISAKNHYRNATSPHKKEEPLGMLSSQGKEIISEFIYYLFYGFSSMLNFFLSLLMISIFIDSRFIISVTISIVAVILIHYMFAKKLERLALVESESGSRLVSTLTLTHDNVHHGSYINRDFFAKKVKGAIKNYVFHRIKENDFHSFIMLITSLISLIPTTILIIYLLLQPDVNFAIKLAIIVNLTRIYHLLNSATDIISIAISLPAQKGRLRSLQCFALAVSETFNRQNIHIEIYDHAENLCKDDISQYSAGRFCVKGSNGSGKSTYLKNVRDKQEAIYFNPSFNVMYPWEDESSLHLSDGQYSKKCILWLLSSTEGPLLLDEWDAFLDQENRKTVSEMIDTAALTRLIIEVRQ